MRIGRDVQTDLRRTRRRRRKRLLGGRARNDRARFLCASSLPFERVDGAAPDLRGCAMLLRGSAVALSLLCTGCAHPGGRPESSAEVELEVEVEAAAPAPRAMLEIAGDVACTGSNAGDVICWGDGVVGESPA